MMNRVNVVCLGVRDMAKSIRFYKGLGFATSEGEDAPVVFFENQGSILELYPLDGLARDVNENNPPALPAPGFCGITLAFTAPTKAAADEVFAKVEALGGTVVKPPETVFWGGYSGYFTDPDGYHWEVNFSDTAWTLDENGRQVFTKQ